MDLPVQVDKTVLVGLQVSSEYNETTVERLAVPGEASAHLEITIHLRGVPLGRCLGPLPKIFCGQMSKRGRIELRDIVHKRVWFQMAEYNIYY